MHRAGPGRVDRRDQHLGMDLLNRVQKDTEVFAKLEQYPKMEGRQMMMVLAPR